ncbi:MAG: TonB-dependent receptor [Bacteroidia bacterium]
MKKYLLSSICIFLSLTSNSQVPEQRIRGEVVDQISQSPLPGASVVLLNSNPLNGTATDADGKFTLSHVAVGLQSIKVSFLGYKEFTLPNINVTSGKEVVLTIQLEESILMGKEIVVTAELRKDRPINEFTTISGRTFSVEETNKYAAAVNDPARMSTAFAGVVSTEDGNNIISVRGNSPAGLIWRMEGVEIPSPNHFSMEGTSGGGISILSSQLLTNSDFLTGAFAAEYGNATSGVFDMKLRKGNNQKTERTIQAGFLGTDLAVEGPFKSGYDGSYLVNYRYSTLSLLNKLGVSVGEGVTNFQDLAYNIYLPTKKWGSFSFWGFGGLSNQNQEAKNDSSKWESDYDRYSRGFVSNTGVSAFSHFMQLSSNTFLKSTLVFSATEKNNTMDKTEDDYSKIFYGNELFGQQKISLNSVLTSKLNARNNIRAGIIVNDHFYNFERNFMNESKTAVENEILQKGSTLTMQGFAQWSYHVTNQLILNSGIHSIFLTLNNSYSIEPRISAKYELNEKQTFSLGYGLHGQMQPLGVYFAQPKMAAGEKILPNKNVGFTKAHHFVAGYDHLFNQYFHIRLEAYFQHLFDVPVSTADSGTFCIINNEFGFVTDPLTNSGIGENKGLELTVEQFLHRDLYFLLSASIYDSKYKAANGNWYNTRYNGGFSVCLTGGKEFKTGEGFGHRTIGINIKTLYSGGLRSTPINFEASLGAGEAKYNFSDSYALQAPDYFRTDFKISVSRNRKRSTTTWSLDIQNLTNRKNYGGEYYDPQTSKIKIYYQTPMIPVLSYKVDF